MSDNSIYLPDEIWLEHHGPCWPISYCDENASGDGNKYIRAGLVPQWISVDERLPPVGTHVIACSQSIEFSIVFRGRWNGEDVWQGGEALDITHWLSHLPPPPTDATQNAGVWVEPGDFGHE